MNCRFLDNSPRTLAEPITVHCVLCGRTVTTDIFPIRANCRGNPIGSFLVKICGGCPGVQPNEIGAPVAPLSTPPGASRLPLGDWLAAGIHFSTLGLITPCTSCQSRAAALNRWGEEFSNNPRETLRQTVSAAMNWLAGSIRQSEKK